MLNKQLVQKVELFNKIVDPFNKTVDILNKIVDFLKLMGTYGKLACKLSMQVLKGIKILHSYIFTII